MAPLFQPAALIYALIVTAVTIVVLLTRLAITWAAEVFLHSIPIAGGWLKSLELVELSVVVLFAVLGFGLGAASQSLPAKTPLPLKALALVLVFPLVFFSSYWLRYHLWLDQMATQSDLPRQQIIEMANLALERESGSAGFWGYYQATTQIPLLPATGDELQRMTEDQRWFRSELTRFSGIEAGVFSIIFDGAGWVVRMFYLALAAITSLIYFLKGIAWADTQRLRHLTKTKLQA
ncbi:MAG: hypothetical protein VKI82_04670 [Leptolyngbya sp.]|nr:hypothetical protein [Leptolyngbya sp.]